MNKKDNKLVLDLTDIVADKVYQKVMERNWEKIEKFKFEMERKIESDARIYAKAVGYELAESIKKINRKNEVDELPPTKGKKKKKVNTS